nr:transposase family protein [Streptomyces tailanensis]
MRKLAAQELLGQLFGITTMTVSRVIREIRPLLEAQDHRVTPSTARFRTPTDIAVYLDYDATTAEIKPAGY